MSARGQSLQGRKVLVKLVDGTKIVDIFKDNTSKHIILAEHGRVRRDQIKKMTPWIEQQYAWASPGGGREFDADQAKAFPAICPMKDWKSGTFAEALGGHGAQYTTCQKVLDGDGACEDHGKVRFTGFEHLHEKKEKDAYKPSLRYTPPRRAGGRSRTRPERMCRTK